MSTDDAAVAAIRRSWAASRQRTPMQRRMHAVWLAWHRGVLRHDQRRCGLSLPAGSQRTAWMPRVCECELFLVSAVYGEYFSSSCFEEKVGDVSLCGFPAVVALT